MSYSDEEIRILIKDVEWQIDAVEKPSAINCNKMLEVIKQLQRQVKNNDLLHSVSECYILNDGKNIYEVYAYEELARTARREDYPNQKRKMCIMCSPIQYNR